MQTLTTCAPGMKNSRLKLTKFGLDQREKQQRTTNPNQLPSAEKLKNDKLKRKVCYLKWDGGSIFFVANFLVRTHTIEIYPHKVTFHEEQFENL